MDFYSHSEQDTERLGNALAAALRGGELIALNGDLGAGKTRLVRAVAAALRCDDALVNSPTFVLWQTYHGNFDLHHLDAYRLRDSDEFLEIGGEELLWNLTRQKPPQAVCFLEWAERVAAVLPTDRVDLHIERQAATVADQVSLVDNLPRLFQFEAGGELSAALLRRLANGIA